MLVPHARRQLEAAPTIPSATRLKVPAGWGVKQVPRPDGSSTDKYYYEPGTGRKFRSIRGVHKYLNGVKGYLRRRSTRRSTCNHNSKHQKMIVSGGKLSRLDHDDDGDDEVENRSDLAIVTFRKPTGMSSFSLPDGWIVEEVPRRNHTWTDKYYYEPGTGRKFRSLVDVERHLEELDDNTPLSKTLEEIKENKPLSKIFKIGNLTKNFNEKKVCKESRQASLSFVGPPMQVKWVLASPQGNTWNPFIRGTSVSDAVKQDWTNRFMLLMKDGNQ
ncbi:methyl-CpG-binding domain-containing protein 7-like [Orobanche gracilis]